MGFLHKLWDETLAGPTPDTGLGKLRKYDSLICAAAAAASSQRSPPAPEDVSRSITLVRTDNPNFKNLSLDPPGSPAGSSAPSSPFGLFTPRTPPAFSPRTPGGEFKRFPRKKSSAEALEHAEPRSPTVYDWIVISALDR